MCGIKYTNPDPVSGKGRSIGLAEQKTACDGADADGKAVSGTKDSGCGEDCQGGSSTGTSTASEGDWLSVAQGQLEDFLEYTNPLSYKAYYCGQGLGADVVNGASGTADDGEVEGDGVRDFSGGPFVLFFHTDDQATNQTTANKVQNNLGFVIKYAVQTGRCR